MLTQSDCGPRLDHLVNLIAEENDFAEKGLSETHLDETIVSAEMEFEGYKLFHNDLNRFGGGVTIYVGKEVDVVCLSELEEEGIVYIFTCRISYFGLCYMLKATKPK